MSTILVPALIVAAIGVVFGIILTIASKVMFVPVNEKVAAVSEAMPGANCGACGFPGCDGYATAIGEGEVDDITRCPVGGPDLAAKLAEIMGLEAGSSDPEVAMVMCTGHTGVTKTIMEDARIHSCKEAKMFYGGQWACAHGCLGLGDCVEACQFNAIGIVNGVAWVDKEACVGCKACAAECPKNIIDMIPKDKLVHVTCKNVDKGAIARKACDTACIGCMKCQKACKFEAIEVENNLARIIYDKCKNCGLCAKECPTGAIVNQRKKKAPAKKPAAPKADAPKAAEAKAEAPKAEETKAE